MMTQEQKAARQVFDETLALMRTEQKGNLDLKPGEYSQDLRDRVDFAIIPSLAHIMVAGRAKKAELNLLLAIANVPTTVDEQLTTQGAVFERELRVATHGHALKEEKRAEPHDPIRGFKTLAAAHSINGTRPGFNEKMLQPQTVARVYASGINARTILAMYKACGRSSLVGLHAKLTAHNDAKILNAFMNEVEMDPDLHADYIQSKLFKGKAGDAKLSFMALPAVEQVGFYQNQVLPLGNDVTQEQKDQLVGNVFERYKQQVSTAVADEKGEYQVVLNRAAEAATQARQAMTQISIARAELHKLDSEASYIAAHGKNDTFVTRQNLVKLKKAFELQKAEKPALIAEVGEAQRNLLKAHAVLLLAQEVVETKKDNAHSFSSLLKSTEKTLIETGKEVLDGTAEEAAKRKAAELKKLNEAQALLDGAVLPGEEKFSLFNGKAEGSAEQYETYAQQGQGAAYIKEVKKELLKPEGEEEKVGFGGAEPESTGDFYAIEISDRWIRWIRCVPWGTGHAMVSVDARNSPLMRLHNIPNDTKGQIELAFKMVENFQKLREKAYYDKALAKAKTAAGDGFDKAVFEEGLKSDPELERIKRRPIYLRNTIATQRSSEMHRAMLAVCSKLNVRCIEDDVSYVNKGFHQYNPLKEPTGFSGWFDRHRFGAGFYTKPTQSDHDNVEKYVKNNDMPSVNGKLLSATSIEDECDEEHVKQAMYARTRR